MNTPATLDRAATDAIVNRLKSIEGQARGIQRMLEDGRECGQIMDQLAALRAATNAATLQAFEVFAIHCLKDPDVAVEQVVAQLISTVGKLSH